MLPSQDKDEVMTLTGYYAESDPFQSGRFRIDHEYGTRIVRAVITRLKFDRRYARQRSRKARRVRQGR